jgi:hypothetical protein
MVVVFVMVMLLSMIVFFTMIVMILVLFPSAEQRHMAGTRFKYYLFAQCIAIMPFKYTPDCALILALGVDANNCDGHGGCDSHGVMVVYFCNGRDGLDVSLPFWTKSAGGWRAPCGHPGGTQNIHP